MKYELNDEERKRIEMMPKEKIWPMKEDPESTYGVDLNFNKVCNLAIKHRSEYFVEKSDNGVKVKRRSDGETIYFTDEEGEVYVLLKDFDTE